MKLTKPNGIPITRWEEWTRPKRNYQWKPGRSAMELAQAWFRDGYLSPPKEIMELLSKDSRLTQLKFILGIPELVTPLPEKGEGRNHDLALVGKTPKETVTIRIEAKADEPFGGDTVAEYWRKAIKRRSKGERTKVPERITALLQVLGQDMKDPTESPWAVIRYQLLTAISGTVIQAKKDKSSLAVFVIHEFRTDSTKKDNLDRNHNEFKKFVGVLLGHQEQTSEQNFLSGPLTIKGIDCFVGKVVVELCEATSRS